MATLNVKIDATLPVFVAKLGVTRNVDITKSAVALIKHGLKQKVNDEHSDISRKDFPDGTDGTAKYVAAVTKAINGVIAKIESGNWSGRADPAGMTDEMMAAVLGMTVDEVRARKAKAAESK